VIGHGTTGGHAWKVTAYEGPWGTCFVTDPGGTNCVPAELGPTAIIGWGGDSAESAAFGSAGPGVALVRVRLSNGTIATARPVGVGNEDLFAFAMRRGLIPVSWTAYDASGKRTGSGVVKSQSGPTGP
jgi:hypothetical protein